MLMLMLADPPHLSLMSPLVQEKRACDVVFTAQISSPSPRSAGLAPRRLPPSAPINHPTGAAALSGPIHPSAFSTRAGSGILGMKRGTEKNNFPSSSTLNPSGTASSPDELEPLLGPFLFPFRFFLFACYPLRPSRIDPSPLRLQNRPPPIGASRHRGGQIASWSVTFLVLSAPAQQGAASAASPS